MKKDRFVIPAKAGIQWSCDSGEPLLGGCTKVQPAFAGATATSDAPSFQFLEKLAARPAFAAFGDVPAHRLRRALTVWPTRFDLTPAVVFRQRVF